VMAVPADRTAAGGPARMRGSDLTRSIEPRRRIWHRCTREAHDSRCSCMVRGARLEGVRVPARGLVGDARRTQRPAARQHRRRQYLHVTLAVLAYLLREGRARRWPAAFNEQLVAALALLLQLAAEDMGLPGWGLHPLKGELVGHWSIWVSGNWRMTLRFEGTDAVLVDYRDYH